MLVQAAGATGDQTRRSPAWDARVAAAEVRSNRSAVTADDESPATRLRRYSVERELLRVRRHSAGCEQLRVRHEAPTRIDLREEPDWCRRSIRGRTTRRSGDAKSHQRHQAPA